MSSAHAAENCWESSSRSIKGGILHVALACPRNTLQPHPVGPVRLLAASSTSPDLWSMVDSAAFNLPSPRRTRSDEPPPQWHHLSARIGGRARGARSLHERRRS